MAHETLTLSRGIGKKLGEDKQVSDKQHKSWRHIQPV